MPIEAAPRIANVVIQIASCLDLKPRQHGYHFAIGFHHVGGDVLARPMLREKLEERGVTQVFLEISALVQILRINFRHRQTVPAKMPRKLEERDVLFAYVIQNANRAAFLVGKPDDVPSRAAQLALQRLDSPSRNAEMLLKKLLENFHKR